ncbi:dihydrolipoyl dehydrogenase family protein [Halovulum sp. GXIMD14794]
MGEHIETDLLVIGAGSGGLSAAAGSAQLGVDTVLLEAGRMGGDCLNFGCVPSKALIAAAAHAQAMRSGEVFGVSPVKPQVDYARAMEHVRETIAGIAPHDSQERFEGLGVRVIREFGRFIAHDTVDAGAYRITARRIVIATGSAPLVPPIPGLEDVPYLTNESLFDLREQPEHLIVIGGGPIGIEMAQAHVRLGSKVTVLEGAKALGQDDPELAAIALDRVRAEGVEIVEGALAEKVSEQGGAITVHTKDGKAYTGSHLLLAVGRSPNVQNLGLEAAGIEYDRTGVKVNSGLRTTNRRVFAIGDAAQGLNFTHVAGYHAGIVVRKAMFGLPAKATNAHIPWATYTDPELAQVGLTEKAARETHGDRLEVVRARFSGNDRARAERETEGMIKVMVVRGRPVGASIVGPHAGELIQVWALAIANRLKMTAIANMVAPYPTLGEVSKRAASEYFSPRLFGNSKVRGYVSLVQRF